LKLNKIMTLRNYCCIKPLNKYFKFEDCLQIYLKSTFFISNKKLKFKKKKKKLKNNTFNNFKNLSFIQGDVYCVNALISKYISEEIISFLLKNKISKILNIGINLSVLRKLSIERFSLSIEKYKIA